MDLGKVTQPGHPPRGDWTWRRSLNLVTHPEKGDWTWRRSLNLATHPEEQTGTTYEDKGTRGWSAGLWNKKSGFEAWIPRPEMEEHGEFRETLSLPSGWSLANFQNFVLGAIVVEVTVGTGVDCAFRSQPRDLKDSQLKARAC